MELPNKNISFLEVCCGQYKTDMSRWSRLGKYRVITHPPKLYHLVTRIKSSSTIIAWHDQDRPFLQQSRRSFFQKTMLDYKQKTWFGFFSYTIIHQLLFKINHSVTVYVHLTSFFFIFLFFMFSLFLSQKKVKSEGSSLAHGRTSNWWRAHLC